MEVLLKNILFLWISHDSVSFSTAFLWSIKVWMKKKNYSLFSVSTAMFLLLLSMSVILSLNLVYLSKIRINCGNNCKPLKKSFLTIGLWRFLYSRKNLYRLVPLLVCLNDGILFLMLRFYYCIRTHFKQMVSYLVLMEILLKFRCHIRRNHHNTRRYLFAMKCTYQSCCFIVLFSYFLAISIQCTPIFYLLTSFFRD